MQNIAWSNYIFIYFSNTSNISNLCYILEIKTFFCFSQVRTDNNSHKRGPKRKTQSVSILNCEFSSTSFKNY